MKRLGSIANINDGKVIAESTPGPIAINMATFIGSTATNNVWGSLLATLGVVLPSFIIILIISIFLKGFLNYKCVKAVLSGIKPVIAGLITATGITMLLGAIFGFKKIGDTIAFDYKALIILVSILLISLLYKKLVKKKISPIILILISAGFGMLLYSI